MENRNILNLMAMSIVMIFLLLSCDSTEKDWKNAKTINSLAEYQKFIKKHSSGIYTVDAQKIVDSLKWVAILKTHNVDSLELFMKNHASSRFLSSSIAKDSLEWGIAYYSKDTSKLSSYIKKYPNSNNIKKAENVIWEINWPPVKVEKANSLFILTKNMAHNYGQMMYYQGNNGWISSVKGMAPEIWIWREMSEGELKLKKKERRLSGIAYLHDKSEPYFKFIRKVDLSKTDKQLCAEFGVSYN